MVACCHRAALAGKVVAGHLLAFEREELIGAGHLLFRNRLHLNVLLNIGVQLTHRGDDSVLHKVLVQAHQANIVLIITRERSSASSAGLEFLRRFLGGGDASPLGHRQTRQVDPPAKGHRQKGRVQSLGRIL